MRSINLKWLNLTLRSDEPNSSYENFLKTPKIKRLEIWEIKNDNFRQKYRKFTAELLNFSSKQPIFMEKFIWSKMTNFEKNAYFENSANFHENIRLWRRVLFFSHFGKFITTTVWQKWNYIRLLWRVFWSGLSTFQIIHFFISPRSRSVPVIKRRSSRLASFSSFRDSKLYRTGFDSRFMSHRLWVTHNGSYWDE